MQPKQVRTRTSLQGNKDAKTTLLDPQRFQTLQFSPEYGSIFTALQEGLQMSSWPLLSMELLRIAQWQHLGSAHHLDGSLQHMES